MRLTFLLLASFPTWFSCTEAKQSGGAHAPKPTPSPQPTFYPEPETDGSDDLTPNCDESSDFHQLDFSEEIKNCLRDEKVYNFDKDACTTMWKATFECSYAGVRRELKTLELNTDNLDAQKGRDLKLIGCGASNDGYTIVTQTWEPLPGKKADCAYEKQGKVVQSCFKKFVGTPPSEPQGEEAVKDYVSDCMKAQ